MAHVVLDSIGAHILGVAYKRIPHLPITYRHTVLTTEYRIRARDKGFSWGVSEYKLGSVRADLYYDREKIAVEVDLGTEGKQRLIEKAKKYSRVRGLNWIVMVTLGDNARLKTFINGVGTDRVKGARFENLDKLLSVIKGA